MGEQTAWLTLPKPELRARYGGIMNRRHNYLIVSGGGGDGAFGAGLLVGWTALRSGRGPMPLGNRGVCVGRGSTEHQPQASTPLTCRGRPSAACAYVC
jgi:hypothetical protein